MSFCVPATSTAVCSETSSGTKSPAAPVAEPITMVASAETATVIVPSVQSAPTFFPSGSPAPGLVQVSG